MKKIVYALLLGCILINCSNNDDTDCSTVLPPPNNFTLKLVDQAGNSLIGNTFVQDSFKLYNNSETLYIKPFPTGFQDELVIFMSEVTNNQEYYLELDQTDTDTLVVNHSINQTDCFSFYILQSFLYNAETIYDIQNGGNDYQMVVTKD